MTADEYLALGETSERYELIDGVVVMSPSPFLPHIEIAVEISFQLKAYARKGERLRVFADADLRVNPATVYRPDLAVCRPGRLPPNAKRLTVVPDLVVEVLSRSSKALDLITKRQDYARFGVREYWVVDPEKGTIRCWRSQGADYLESPIEGDALVSSAIPGFTLDLRPVRELIAPG